MVLYILKFILIDSKRNDKRFWKEWWWTFFELKSFEPGTSKILNPITCLSICSSYHAAYLAVCTACVHCCGWHTSQLHVQWRCRQVGAVRRFQVKQQFHQLQQYRSAERALTPIICICATVSIAGGAGAPPGGRVLTMAKLHVKFIF